MRCCASSRLFWLSSMTSLMSSNRVIGIRNLTHFLLDIRGWPDRSIAWVCACAPSALAPPPLYQQRELAVGRRHHNVGVVQSLRDLRQQCPNGAEAVRNIKGVVQRAIGNDQRPDALSTRCLATSSIVTSANQQHSQTWQIAKMRSARTLQRRQRIGLSPIAVSVRTSVENAA